MIENLKSITDSKIAIDPASQKEAGFDGVKTNSIFQHHPESEVEKAGSTSAEMLFVDPASEEFYY